MEQESLLIDFYNLYSVYQERNASSSEKSIYRVVYQLESYAADSGKQLVLVFDGVRFKSQIPDSKILTLMFSKPGQPADELIEKMMFNISQNERIYWEVVTDDIAIKNMASGYGLRVKPCIPFIEEFLNFGRNSLLSKPKIPSKEKNRPFNNPFSDL